MPHHLHTLPAGTWVDYCGIPMRLMNATQVQLTDWSRDALQEQLEYDREQHDRRVKDGQTMVEVESHV